MSDNNLTVKVGADVVDLQAKLAIAKAEFSAFNSTLRNAAKEAASSGIGGALTSQLVQASEAMLQARARVDSLTGSLDKVGVHTTGLREINATLHELMTGDVSRLPISFARLGESFFELGPEALARVAGVAALGGAFYELVKNAVASTDAIQQARVAFAWQGLPETTSQIKDMTAQIAAIPGVTEKSAGATMAALSTIKGSTPELFKGVIALLPDLIEHFGSAEKAAEEFARGWNDIQEKGGDTIAYVQRFISAATAIDKTFDESRVTAKSWSDSLLEGFAGVAGGAEQVAGAVGKIDASKLEANAAAIKALFASLGSGVVAPKDTSTALDQFRLTVDKMEASFKGGHEAMLAEAVKMWQSEVSTGQLAGRELLEAQTSLAQAQKELNSTVAEDAKQQANKALEAQKQAARQTQEIDKSDAETTLQVSKIRIQTERDTLDAQVSAGAISEKQKEQQLLRLADEEYRLDRQRLQAELDSLDTSTAAWHEAYNKIEVFDTQHQADRAKINQQIAADTKKTANDDVQAWQGAVRQIKSAESGLISNIFSGRQTLGESLLQMTGRLVQQELTDDAKYLTQSLLLNQTAEEKKAALKEAGSVLHFAINALGLSSDETTQATATASTVSGEATQVAAVTAGEQAKVVAKAAAATEGHAISAATGGSEVMADAAKGAAGAYSALAGIPIVGPVLGAAAAGVTFAAIAAYEGLASAEGGMLTVPSDNFLINAHKNEMMLPAYIASPMRSFFEDGIQPNTQALGGGSASVASGGGDIHIVQTINVTAIDGASVVAHANKFAPIYAKAVSTQFQRSLSTRGKY